MVYVIIIWYLVINVVSFVIYGADKKKAERGQWRIPEAILLLLPIIGGSLGALLAMAIFHHKTSHRRFRIIIPLVLAAQVIFVILYSA